MREAGGIIRPDRETNDLGCAVWMPTSLVPPKQIGCKMLAKEGATVVHELARKLKDSEARYAGAISENNGSREVDDRFDGNAGVNNCSLAGRGVGRLEG